MRGGGCGGIQCMLCLPGDAGMLSAVVSLVAQEWEAEVFSGDSWRVWPAVSPCAYIILSV